MKRYASRGPSWFSSAVLVLALALPACGSNKNAAGTGGAAGQGGSSGAGGIAGAGGTAGGGGSGGGSACDSCSGSCVYGRCQITLAPAGDSGEYIAIDATNAYWADLSSNQTPTSTVSKVPLAGGSPSVVYSFPGVAGGIAVDATNLYLTDTVGGEVTSVPLSGGAATKLATTQYGEKPSFITLDAANVYWRNDTSGAVMEVPKSGGTPTTISAGPPCPYPGAPIAVDANNVYWGAPGAVMTVAKSGGTPSKLASLTGVPTGLALDSANVYYTTEAGQAMKVAKSGGTPALLGAAPQPGTSGIVVDATNAYFTGTDGNQSILQVPLAGGKPEVIVPGHTGALAVDATSVYWTDIYYHAVMKVTPK